jgi:N-acetylneuraminic acid mutarotase
MKRSCVAALSAFILGAILLSTPLPADGPAVAPLPLPLTNNAVALLRTGKQPRLFSFMGLGAGKTWKDITNQAFELNFGSDKWAEIHPVPGTVGRLAASAVGVREQVVLFGGYVVDGQGSETTVPDVNIYRPDAKRWYRGADIPVAVDDAVIGTFKDRYVYLISGWSNKDAVKDVQVYDAEKDTWRAGTPITGTPVFGHAGAIFDDTIVYVDGAYRNPNGDNPKYVTSEECWVGKIDHHDPTKIEWSKIPNHPGTARYRIAAGVSAHDRKIYFFGGTDNPYNYNGIGYNGQPSEPSAMTFAWDVRGGKWETVNENTPGTTMDSRGLLATPAGLVAIGGMDKGQQVTAKVTVVPRNH